MGVPAYIGLGSNLGPRREKIGEAVRRLDRIPGVRLLRTSSLIETAPVGGPHQGPYLNGIAEVEAEIPPEDLLTGLHRIEEALGRVRDVRWGPRVIDLDLLIYGEETRDGPDLVLPHPRVRERAFVLRPLAELAPDLAVPPDGTPVRDLLLRLEGAGR